MGFFSEFLSGLDPIGAAIICFIAATLIFSCVTAFIISLVIAKGKDKKIEYGIINNILKETFVEFGNKMEDTLRQTVEAFAEKLTGIAVEVATSSKTLDIAVEKFGNSLKNFSENIKDFGEFNTNFKNNIQRMDANFIKVTEALVDTSKIVVDNYNVAENFSKDIKEAAGEITSYNRQVVQDMANIIGEVGHTAGAIKEMGELIRDDLAGRMEEIKEYQSRLNDLTNKLDEEVNLLGEKASGAFIRTLDESGNTISDKITQGIGEVLKDIMAVMDDFTENEKNLAKTIISLPNQVIAYNETAAAQVEKQLDEVKRLFKK